MNTSKLALVLGIQKFGSAIFGAQSIKFHGHFTFPPRKLSEQLSNQRVRAYFVQLIQLPILISIEARRLSSVQISYSNSHLLQSRTINRN